MTRMVLVLVLILACVAGFAQSGIVQADVLLIEEVRQSERMNLPENGMSMAEVLARFGEPVDKRAAVGNPPITQWDYEKWSVYFEYETVLFSVLHKGAVIDKSRRSDSSSP